jgi:hypothetical protein
MLKISQQKESSIEKVKKSDFFKKSTEDKKNNQPSGSP